MKTRILTIVLFAFTLISFAQKVEIGREGSESNMINFKTSTGANESYSALDVRCSELTTNRVIFYDKQTGKAIITEKGFPISKVTLATFDPLFSKIGASFTDYEDFKEKWASLNLGKSTASGGSDAENVDIDKFGKIQPVEFEMTVGSNSTPASSIANITESHLLNDGKEDGYCQGGWHIDTVSGAGNYRQFPSSTTNGANIPSIPALALSWRVTFKVSGAFSIRMDGSDTLLPLFQIWVDGKIYNPTNPTNVNGGRRWLTVNAGAGVHYVKVIAMGETKWFGYMTEQGAIAEPWKPTRTSIFFGDSFTAGAVGNRYWDAYSYQTNLTSNHNVISSGVGGAGYVSDGDKDSMDDRIIPDYNLIAADNGTPDDVFIAMGVNDLGQTGIEAAANLTFDNLRTVYQGNVYVITPWDVAAPNSPNNNYETARTEIINAAKDREGFYIIDVKGVAFTKGDPVHPDTEGHKTLGDYIRHYLLSPFEELKETEPEPITTETGTEVINTLNQLSGNAWTSLSSVANPATGAYIWELDDAFYLEEGNKRYYSLRLYLDNDSPITFEVTGAIDIVAVSGNGYSMESDDISSRMVTLKRTDTNTIYLDRDNSNDVDMWIDLTFTAIMN